MALPPLKSKTAAVENEFSSLANQVTNDANSSTFANLFLGILITYNLYVLQSFDQIILVFAAAGVTQFYGYIFFAQALYLEILLNL